MTSHQAPRPIRRIAWRYGIAIAIFAALALALWQTQDHNIPRPNLSGSIEQQGVYGEVSRPDDQAITGAKARLTIRSRPYPNGDLRWRGTQYTKIDDAGEFDFGLSPLGLEAGASLHLSLRIQAQGCLPLFEERQVTLDQLPLRLDLALETGPGIYGRVVDAKGTPLADARIRFGEQETWTSEEGIFGMAIDAESLPGSVHISHPRHGVASVVPVDFSALAQDLGDITIDQSLGQLSGLVTSPAKQAIKGLRLTLKLIASTGQPDPRAFDELSLETDAHGRIEAKSLAQGIYRITYADPGTELGLARLLGESWHLRKHTGTAPFTIVLPYSRVSLRCLDASATRLDSVVRAAVWEGEIASRAKEFFSRDATMPDELLDQAVILSDDFHPGRLDSVWAKPQSFVAFFALNGPGYEPCHAATLVEPGQIQIELTESPALRQGDFGTLKLSAVDAAGVTINPATWRVEMARIGGIVGFSREDQWIGNGVRTTRGTIKLRVVPGKLKIWVQSETDRANPATGRAELTVAPGETRELTVTLKS